MRIRRFLHLILLLGACGLVWKVWSTWSHSWPPIVTNTPSSLNARVPMVSRAGPEIGKRLSQLITAKNLFSPDRRTARDEVPKKPEKPLVPPPKHLKLVGVVLTGGRNEALFSDASKGGKVVRVMAGGVFESYQVARLTHSEAVLTLGEGGREVSLRINVQKSIDAAKAPRIIPARPKPQAKAKPTEEGAEGGRSEGKAPPVLGGSSAPAPVLGAGTAEAAVTTASSASGEGQDEALSLRQNIRQLQRRLREIRRQRARERRDTRADGRGE